MELPGKGPEAGGLTPSLAPARPQLQRGCRPREPGASQGPPTHAVLETGQGSRDLLALPCPCMFVLDNPGATLAQAPPGPALWGPWSDHCVAADEMFKEGLNMSVGGSCRAHVRVSRPPLSHRLCFQLLTPALFFAFWAFVKGNDKTPSRLCCLQQVSRETCLPLRLK